MLLHVGKELWLDDLKILENHTSGWSKTTGASGNGNRFLEIFAWYNLQIIDVDQRSKLWFLLNISWADLVRKSKDKLLQLGLNTVVS